MTRCGSLKSTRYQRGWRAGWPAQSHPHARFAALLVGTLSSVVPADCRHFETHHRLTLEHAPDTDCLVSTAACKQAGLLWHVRCNNFCWIRILPKHFGNILRSDGTLLGECNFYITVKKNTTKRKTEQYDQFVITCPPSKSALLLKMSSPRSGHQQTDWISSSWPRRRCTIACEYFLLTSRITIAPVLNLWHWES